MEREKPYNPLDKANLGVSVADALLAKPPVSLPPAPFVGAGIYAIYYVGKFREYEKIAALNRGGRLRSPIYVGKAVPAGSRKGGVLGEYTGSALYVRMKEHAESIEQARNLDLKDFFCRYLVVEDIWIPLGESLLIDKFSPLWNKVIDGFGNHDPGSGRHGQKKSAWDIVHPGRSWATKLTGVEIPGDKVREDTEKFIEEYVRSLSKNP